MHTTHREDLQGSFFLLLSILLTVVFEVVFFLAISRIDVPWIRGDDETKRPPVRVEVEPVDLQLPSNVPPPEPTTALKQQLLNEEEKKLAELLPLPAAARELRTELKPVLTGLGRNLIKPELPVPPRVGTVATSPPPEIISISARDVLPERLADSSRTLVAGIPRFPGGDKFSPSLVSGTPGGGLPGMEGVGIGGLRIGLPSGPGGVLDWPGAGPAAGGGLPPLPVPPLTPGNDGASTRGGERPPEQIDHLVNIRLTVYHDPAGGGGYYRLEITANEQSARMALVPKDVLILLDASASITNPKLREFRRGLDQAFGRLQPDDRFNVVLFRQETTPLFPDFTPPSEENVAKARKFVEDLRALGKTDVYGSLSPFLQNERPATERPLLVFLISDGRATTGHLLQNNEFIRRATLENHARASIFAFSAGDETNLFLMDYLSYKNRGYSLHVKELGETDDRLAAYLTSLNALVVRDPVCRVTGGLQPELFPREMPHLFRGHPLTLWGRFPADTRELAFQITGRGRDDQGEELVVRQELAKATVGGPEVATEWAAQKIYHLVSEWTFRNSPEIRDQIRQLATRYQIVVPY